MNSGSEKDELNGVSGRYFGDDVSKVFLPAAGTRWNNNGEMSSIGSDGYYWSSTVDECYAHLLHFPKDFIIHMGRSNRAAGFSIRCVAEH
jgi:hypothetical protein